MKIWANCIVHNEENFIWFSIMSVIDYVDKILVWDSGSTDKTVEIIKEIKKKKGDKIEFKEVGSVDKLLFTKMRQKMLEQSECDWILVLDGDEVWWEESIKEIKEKIKSDGDKLDAIVVPFYNIVGDIYHHQSSQAGQYRLLGKKGHLTVKAVNRKISGLHWSKPYGKEGLYDENGISIQNRETNRLVFLRSPFLHFTHLRRSPRDLKKFKYDLGIKFPKNFRYPEILNKERPEIVHSPWKRRSEKYKVISLIKKPYQILWRMLKNRYD